MSSLVARIQQIQASTEKARALLAEADRDRLADADWDGPASDLLMLALAQVLDGLSVGHARHLLYETAKLLACNTRFSVSAPEFAQEAQAREALAAQKAEQLRAAIR